MQLLSSGVESLLASAAATFQFVDGAVDESPATVTVAITLLFALTLTVVSHGRQRGPSCCGSCCAVPKQASVPPSSSPCQVASDYVGRSADIASFHKLEETLESRAAFQSGAGAVHGGDSEAEVERGGGGGDARLGGYGSAALSCGRGLAWGARRAGEPDYAPSRPEVVSARSRAFVTSLPVGPRAARLPMAARDTTSAMGMETRGRYPHRLLRHGVPPHHQCAGRRWYPDSAVDAESSRAGAALSQVMYEQGSFTDERSSHRADRARFGGPIFVSESSLDDRQAGIGHAQGYAGGGYEHACSYTREQTPWHSYTELHRPFEML